MCLIMSAERSFPIYRFLKRVNSGKEYANGGCKQEQSAFVFGDGEGLERVGKKMIARFHSFESVPGATPNYCKTNIDPRMKASDTSICTGKSLVLQF